MKSFRPHFGRGAPPFGRAIALFLGLALAAIAQAQPPDKDKVSLNFVNADIESVVKTVSIISGRNFVLDPRVKGTISVVSANPIAPELAYPILISALRLQGFTVVDGNGTGLTKIIPEADAKTHAIPTTTRGVSHEYRLVTRVFPIRSESATQLLPILRPLVTANNSISVYPANNTLVITDYADNIKRLERVIQSIEQGSSENPAVFRLKHLAATDIAGLLSKLFGDGSPTTAADPGQRASIIADPRSNSIIVRSENSAVLGRIRTLLGELDQAPLASGNIHVVPLKNAEATKLAQTLRAILSGEVASPAASAPTGLSGAAATAAAAAGSSGSGQDAPKSGGLASGSSIQADATTNSLIIVAPEPVFNNLRHVIEALDRRRAQVYIEALIVEVSADRATELGFQWQTINGNSALPKLFGGTNFGVGTGQNISSAGSGRNGAGLTVGIVKNGSLGVLARFLETDTDANILSMPNLITLDNEEGKIVIGQNLPFVTGQYAQTGTSLAPFQTIERRDVGLSLKVKPQISEGGSIRVLISQEVSSVNSDHALGPVTNKRSIDSMVLVDDGGIIALGGLMEDSYGSGKEKVPVLGDIPILGELFRYNTRKRKKTNLMVFLRPQVIRDEASYERLAAEQYGRVQGEQVKASQVSRLMPGEEAPPQLPGNAQGLRPKAGPNVQKGSAVPEKSLQ